MNEPTIGDECGREEEGEEDDDDDDEVVVVEIELVIVNEAGDAAWNDF